jgi:hypothetical protein
MRCTLGNLTSLPTILPGWFEYDIPDAPYPIVKRCCAIYQTKGEKRLGNVRPNPTCARPPIILNWFSV